MAKPKVTLKDVARHAGVSVGSVSRYLNQHPSVSDKARRAIEEAVKELDFIPNQMAQKLARGITGNLLLYIYQEFPIFNTTWLFELPIIHGIYDYLQTTGYSLQIAIGSISNPEQFKRDILHQVDSRLVDGVLILSSWPAESSTVEMLIERGFPYALIGNANQIASENYIIFDNEKAEYDLAVRLLDLGHQDVAYLGGFESQLHTQERLAGLKRALDERNIPLPEDRIRFGDYTFESGRQLMDEMLRDNPPTAVICGNDFVAAGAIQSAKRHGLRVPEDISIVGFDDLTVATIVEPELTTVSVPLFEMGRLATRNLMESIADKRTSFPPASIDCRIIQRNSIDKVCAAK